MIQGVRVAGGNFYLGTHLVFDGHEIDGYAVNPELSARSEVPDVDGSSMPYWPSYAQITPAARRAFLEWMSTGRRSSDYGIAHVFLYFYGIEHRVFAEREAASTSALITEVERLVSIYGDNGSFAAYAGKFLDCARCALNLPLPVPQPAADRSFSTDTPNVLLHLGRSLSSSSVMSSEDALIWVLSLPDVYLRTPAVRCFGEFIRLWHLRFPSEFPKGLKVATKKTIELKYRAASGMFETIVDGRHRNYPDVRTTTTSPEQLRELVQKCTEELDGFSRLVGRRPEDRDSLQAALLLPEDLAGELKLSAVRDFKRRLADLMGGQQLALSNIESVLRICEMDVPESGKITSAVADQLGQLLDRFDVAIEPDRRYGGGVPLPLDQVILFNASRGGPVDPEKTSYRAMKTQVEVAVLAAAADEEASVEEMNRVVARIKAEGAIGPVEKARLMAFAVTLFKSPPRQARVLNRLAERTTAEREAIAKVAIMVVSGDGNVKAEEVRFLEKLHKTLGLSKESVYSGLHEAAATPDGPVPISVERRQPGIPIPKQAPIPNTVPKSRVKIDAARLARARQETEKVSELLASIFEEETAPSPADDSTGSIAGTSAFEGLDRSHSELIELIEFKGSLSKVEFDERARVMKLLPEGAMERINDWSFDLFDEPLLEDGDEIVMVAHLRPRLAELRETA